MPYAIKSTPGGFVVVTRNTGAVHSKQPLSWENANSQCRALSSKLHGGIKGIRLGEEIQIKHKPVFKSDLLNTALDKGVGLATGNKFKSLEDVVSKGASVGQQVAGLFGIDTGPKRRMVVSEQDFNAVKDSLGMDEDFFSYRRSKKRGGALSGGGKMHRSHTGELPDEYDYYENKGWAVPYLKTQPPSQRLIEIQKSRAGQSFDDYVVKGGKPIPWRIRGAPIPVTNPTATVPGWDDALKDQTKVSAWAQTQENDRKWAQNEAEKKQQEREAAKYAEDHKNDANWAQMEARRRARENDTWQNLAKGAMSGVHSLVQNAGNIPGMPKPLAMAGKELSKYLQSGEGTLSGWPADLRSDETVKDYATRKGAELGKSAARWLMEDFADSAKRTGGRSLFGGSLFPSRHTEYYSKSYRRPGEKALSKMRTSHFKRGQHVSSSARNAFNKDLWERYNAITLKHRTPKSNYRLAADNKVSRTYVNKQIAKLTREGNPAALGFHHRMMDENVRDILGDIAFKRKGAEARDPQRSSVIHRNEFFTDPYIADSPVSAQYHINKFVADLATRFGTDSSRYRRYLHRLKKRGFSPHYQSEDQLAPFRDNEPEDLKNDDTLRALHLLGTKPERMEPVYDASFSPVDEEQDLIDEETDRRGKGSKRRRLLGGAKVKVYLYRPTDDTPNMHALVEDTLTWNQLHEKLPTISWFRDADDVLHGVETFVGPQWQVADFQWQVLPGGRTFDMDSPMTLKDSGVTDGTRIHMKMKDPRFDKGQAAAKPPYDPSAFNPRRLF